MKKVLVIITTAFVPYGGLATVALNYYRHIDKSRINMDFASTNIIDEELMTELQCNGSRYYQLPNRVKNPINYMNKVAKISKGYDIVHIHANSATAVLELLPARIVSVRKRIIHIHNSTCNHMIIHKMFHPLVTLLATDRLACSKKAGDWIFDEYIVINNAVSINKYKFDMDKRESIRGKYNIKDDSLVIGHVGKFIEQKNHRFMIDVFEQVVNRIPDAKLLLVGDGVLRREMEDRVKNKGLSNSVIFCGMQNCAAKYYSAMDVMLFPSLWEGLPLSILEAQVNGLQCILSDNITPEVNMGGVQQVSLSENASVWADVVVNTITIAREARSQQYQIAMNNNGYNVEKNVITLEEIYMS